MVRIKNILATIGLLVARAALDHLERRKTGRCRKP